MIAEIWTAADERHLRRLWVAMRPVSAILAYFPDAPANVVRALRRLAGGI